MMMRMMNAQLPMRMFRSTTNTSSSSLSSLHNRHFLSISSSSSSASSSSSSLLLMQQQQRSWASSTRIASASAASSAANASRSRRGAEEAISLMPGSKSGSAYFKRQILYAKLAAFVAALGIAQVALGEADNFFEHKFTTHKHPQDLADFYGTEDFMEVFCVFPFVQTLMMRAAQFDDEGNIHAWGLLGPELMNVMIDFDEKEEDVEGFGNTITWFNKHESFTDTAPAILGGFTLWTMTQNFGYNLKPDGTCEVYHHGEHFKGFFPMRLVFWAHSYYVIWATEQYVNSDEFGNEDRVDDAQGLRHNVPAHVFQDFVSDLSAQIEQLKTSLAERTDFASNAVAASTHAELERTLRRLDTLQQTTSTDVEGKIAPKIRTFRSHRTLVTTSHLSVDDAETKDTLRTAMNQLQSYGSVGGKSKGVSSSQKELHKLQRRLTVATMEDVSNSKQQPQSPPQKA